MYLYKYVSVYIHVFVKEAAAAVSSVWDSSADQGW